MEKRPRGRPFLYDKDEIIRLFKEENLAPKIIAVKIGCSISRVWGILNETRTPEEKAAYWKDRMTVRHLNLGEHSERTRRGTNVGVI